MATYTIQQSGGDFSSLSSALGDAGTAAGDVFNPSGTWTVADTAAATCADNNITVSAVGDSRVDKTALGGGSHYRLSVDPGTGSCIGINNNITTFS